MSDLADQISHLSPAQQKLLMARLRKKRQEGVPTGRVEPSSLRAAGGPLPVSFAQERLWFLHRLEPESPLYNVPLTVGLAGDLVPSALGQALHAIAARHEALRCRFPEESGRPRLVVGDDAPARPAIVDLSGLTPEAGRRQASRGSLAAARRPFDLAARPPVRPVLLRLGGTEHRLALVFHHVVFDGWSRGVLVREVSTLYPTFAAGRPAPLPPLPVQYADFADWQRRRLSGERLEGLLAHWRERLAGIPPALTLPTDRPPPRRPSHRGGRVPVTLPSATGRALGRFGTEQRGTPFMVLLAGFAALLARHAGQDDVSVATPVAGRDQAEVEGLIGVFVNQLVLRLDLSGEPTGRRLVDRAREVARDAFEHRELPFERLVAELEPERTGGRAPLAQAVLALQNLDASPASLPGLTLSLEEGEVTTAKVDLTLHLTERPDGGLGGALEYAADLFDRTTAARLARRLEVLLTALGTTPDRPVSELPMMPAAERQQTLSEWGGPAPPVPVETTPVERFAGQARRAPDRVAVVEGEAHLSYGTLHRRALALARLLAARGAGPESRVALSFERSTELVAALLGVQLAGAAYVPLDPAHPEERRRFVTEDSGAVRLLTAADLPPAGGEGDLPAPPHPASLGYVIYTSGSTGRPKGVLVPHGHVARLFDATRESFGFDEDDVWTLFHSPAFDFSVWEIWGPLLHGGRLVAVPYLVGRSPESFAGLLENQRVTVLNQTPSAFRQLQAVEAGRDLSSLRRVIFGGEALDPGSLAPWLSRHGDGREGRGPVLVNMYGITETTVHVTFRRLRADDSKSVIGRGIADLGLVLLDRRGRPVPIGVPGEIHVAGAGLARGYLGRPALTAERFVPDPFTAEPGGRLYRSGDLARWLPDGDVEFLGRIDHQVQLRGFRIELGEVEAVLAAHPGVREVAVLVAGEGEVRRLVAYVATDDVSGLRELAAARLPDYMVPGLFVRLDVLPLTANGKVDRRALTEVTVAPAEPERRGSEPRTPAEEILAGLFADVLERERVGVTDSFFDLGGHSLLATQLLARARRSLGVEIPLQALFEHPSVRELAAVAEGARGAGALPPPLLPTGGAEREIPSYSQERLWFLDRLDPGTPAYDISLRLLLQGPLPAMALAHALAEVIRRHEVLRSRFPEADGAPRVVVVVVVPLRPNEVLGRVDLTGLPPGERAAESQRLAREAATISFDLATGPLLRAALVKTAAEQHLWLLTVHHVVADGWSLGVLRREMSVAAGAFATGEPSPLPELPIQYVDYAAWQRRWLAGETLERRVGYWRGQLAGVSDLELPTDRPRPPVQTFAGRRVPWNLPAAEVAPLASLARRQGATLFMVLAAGLRTLLGRWSGQRDFALGTFIANRTREETEGLVGFFVNNLALRAPLSPRYSFAEQVERERETALAAYAHQDVPFETLLTALDVRRDMSRSSLFQAMLVLQNTPMPDLGLPGVSVESLAGKEGRANFDLTLWTYEDDGALRGSFEVPRALFDAATVSRLAGHLSALLRVAAQHPETSLAELPLLTAAELAQVTGEWAAPPAPDPAPPLHRLIAGHAETGSDRVAVVAGADGGPTLQVSYRELWRRALRLAAALGERGVGRGHRVGIYAERSPEVLAALLGVLEAGAAYVPVDAAYGAGRLAGVVEEADLSLLLTHRRLLPEEPAVEVWDLDEALAADRPTAPSPEILPQDAAYVIFTSGSTGKPKGVVVPHVGLSTLYRAWEETYRLGEIGCHLQMASLSFDVFAGDWVRALGSGAKLVLAPADLLLQPVPLWQLARHEGAEAAEFVPAVMRGIAEHLEETGGDLSPLKLLAVGSDSWYVEEMRRVERLLPAGCRLVDSYGVTEATIDSTVFEHAAVDLPGEALAPVGRPFPGCRVYVTDPELRPVAAGVPGELLLGGDGVAQGYLGRPALTAERFVPDRLGTRPGERLYRTGDRARWLADGNLSLLGRMDHQIKVRGLRIEPGEIEAALAEHPAVAQAVVAARGPGLGQERLVAYVRLTSGVARDAVSGRDLAGFLAQRLPAYMVPQVFEPVERFPLNVSGKVDRRALPEPDWGAARLGGEHVPPEPGLETALAAVFGDLLGIERVGATGGFFELGGHSLSATRLVSRVRSELGAELPLRAVFEEPSVRGLARRIAALGGRPGDTSIEPVPRDGLLPLSFAQERLWLLDRLDPGRPTYHLVTALAVEGPLDVPRLRRAVGALVDRHETLRTTFVEVGGEPRQRIRPEGDVPVPLVDLARLPPVAREREADRLGGLEARRPFDLAGEASLLRLTLLYLDATLHRALLTQHHVVSDAWSMGVFWNDLAQLYAGTELPPLPVQYAEFAVWQRRTLTPAVLDRQVAYWRRRLGERPPVLELPADRPRPPVPSQRGLRLPVHVPAGVAGGVRALAEANEATAYMVLLAGFGALLHRLSGQPRVTVGTPVANRTRAEVEGLIGFFVNTLAMDVDLSGSPRFTALVEQTRETALGAYEHQDLPFERLVEALSVERDLSRTPLFQAMLVFQNAPPVSASRIGELSLEPLAAGTGTAKFDLGLELFERGEALAGHLEIATDLFDRTTGERWIAHFLRLLEAAAGQPDRPVDELPILSTAEAHQLLREVQDTGTEEPSLPLAQVSKWIARTPDAVAVTGTDRALTYGELDRRAATLATRLSELGVRGGHVALCLDPSPETAVAVLAAWRAGATYVPLDPSHPAERLVLCLEDARPRVLLTFGPLPSGLGVSRGRVRKLTALSRDPETGPSAPHLLRLDDPQTWEDDEPRDEIEPGPESGAYVIYTSGSTGRPKGVEVSHGAVGRLWAWWRQQAAGRPPRVAMAGAPGFDVQVIELGSALAAGGSAHAAGPDDRRDPERLLGWLEREQVTLTFLVAPVAEIVMAASPPSLARLVSGGDRLTRRPSQGTVLAVDNAYGPTEATVIATIGPVSAGEARPPEIGLPRAGTTAHVVDRDLRPVALGVVGELVLGGDGIARGYRNLPARTAAAFAPDPFSGRPGARLYRSGDRARRLPDGRLEFLGRLDRQVQVRGFRVEPGEVEAVLVAHPQVSAAAVLARATPDGGSRLDAFVTGAAGFDPARLRSFAQERLPSPMVPASFTLLPELPLTVHRKVNREALSKLAAAPAATGELTGPAEELVGEIWRDVLALDHVGPDDDFFAAGGHSLAAARLAARVRDAFGVEVPLARIFEAPTVRALSAEVEIRRTGGAGLGVRPILPVPRDRPLPLSPAQERMWLLTRLDPTGAAYNVPLALALEGDLSALALGVALADLARRHESLRTVFALEGDRPVQRVAPAGSPAPLPVVDLSALEPPDRDRTAPRLSRALARRPFDLENGPVWRRLLVRLEPERHLLALSLSHAVADEEAVRLLSAESLAAYRALLRGVPSPLPPPTLQAADHAAWQRDGLMGETLDRLLGFWKTRLDPLPEPLDLPPDRPRPRQRSYAGAIVHGELPPVLTARLRQAAGRWGATTFLVALAAFEAWLSRLSGRDRFVIGTPISERDRPELAGIVGVLLNTLALPADLAGEPTFEVLVSRCRHLFLAAWDHRDLPFETLIEELAPPRDTSRAPVAQVQLVLQRPGRELPGLPGLILTPVGAGTGTAKLDLTLFVQDDGEQLGLGLEYASDLFEPTTARRWLAGFRSLLEAALDAPGTPLPDLPSLPAAERHALLHEHARQPTAPCPALLFPAHSEPFRWSYAELAERVAELAGRLRASGAGPETTVAVELPRGPELVAATVAVLASGAVWLPLDPDQPDARLTFIRQDAGAALAVRAGGEIVRLAPPTSKTGRATREVDSRSLAYLLYTSGSTGRPKGVMVHHGGLAAYLQAAIERYGLGSGRTVLLHTSPAFDLTVTSLLAPLAAGATVEVLPAGADLPALAHRLAHGEPLDLLKLTPAHLDAVTRLLPEPRPRLARVVVVGGEALHREQAAPLAAAPPAALFNEYGPTETVVGSTLERVPIEADRTGTLPIGRPIAGASVHAVDRGGRPVPLGAWGEAWIGGPTVARGYLGKPALTADRFRPDPFAASPGERVYRTGDLIRHLADGRLCFLGRRDHQVKVRGVRIELGEIEAVLLTHPEVAQAAVDVRDYGEGDRRLVAWAAPTGGVTADTLHGHLAERLPAAMMPSAIVLLDRLPLTPHGKVDREALPEPEQTVASQPSEPPRNAVEEVLAGMFAEILGIDEVGRSESFFDLGGHSLTAARLLTWMRESFGMEIPLARVFDEPTVAALAADLLADPAERERVERTAELLLEMAEIDEDELEVELSEESA